jgi:HlyD family secretion protein
MTHRLAMAALVLLMLAGLALASHPLWRPAGTGAAGPGAAAAAAAAAAAQWRTVAIERGAITQTVQAFGTLQPLSVVNVGTQIGGTVVERLADFNDRVQRGQVLVRLDPATLQARVQQTEAQLASAEAAWVAARAAHERQERLLGQGFVSSAALEQHRRDLDAARAGVEIARAQRRSALADLGHSVIRSPIDGVVIRRNVEVGQTVTTNFQTPDLFQIAASLSQMLIHAQVAESDIGAVAEGQPVHFTVDAFAGHVFEGRVRQVRLAASQHQGVVSYTVLVTVANPDGRLKPGMTAQLRILVRQRPDVLRVPTAALRFEPPGVDLPPPRPAAAQGGHGARLWAPAPGGALRAHDVVTGVADPQFTELREVPPALQVPGAQVVVRRLAPDGGAAP